MPSKIHIYTFACACLLLIFLSSCHTAKKSTAYHPASKPKFINDIYLNGHNKSSATANAIEPKKAIAEKPKQHTKTRTEEKEKEKEEELGLAAYSGGSTTVISTRHRNKSEQEIEPPKVKETEKQAEDDDNDEADRKNPTRADKKIRKKYAEMIGVRNKDITNYPLYQFIDRWYGTNYRLGGCDESGIDCSGFARKLYGDVYGVDLLRTAMDQFKDSKHIKHADNAEEGDLVFFKQHGKRITHVGVYLANDFFVHASTSQGVIISNLKEEYWHKHYAGVGRVSKGG